jgi:hypothetical protein
MMIRIILIFLSGLFIMKAVYVCTMLLALPCTGGAILVSCNFLLPGWRPEQEIRAKHPVQKDPIYIYRQRF